MRTSRLAFWMTWLLIASQGCVLVFGHGRVVVCHDEAGSSHIEIVDESSCSPRVGDGCTELISGLGGDGVSSVCSDSSCVDEPFGLLATLSGTRISSYGQDQGVHPNPSLAIVSWLVSRDPMVGLDRGDGFDDGHAIAGFHRSNRSSVLVL